MNSVPLVSIVTPCYNMGRFLEQTIESVLAQDYPNIEYIVMDGGSSDDSLRILEKYRGRLEFHSGQDRGTADAINQGFERSRGSVSGRHRHGGSQLNDGAGHWSRLWRRELGG